MNLKSIMKTLLVTFIVLALVACGNGTEENGSGDKKDLKIAIVTSASGENDNGYNQSASVGLKEIADEISAEVRVIEPATGVGAAMETLAADGYNVIFNLEYDFDALVNGVGGAKPIAEQFPDTWFVV